VASEEPKYHEILLRLADAGVESIVVGMVAAVLQGVTSRNEQLGQRILRRFLKSNPQSMKSIAKSHLRCEFTRRRPTSDVGYA